MMHDHDLELIFDLVGESGLPPSEVVARLDGCEPCLADFAEQRQIVELLGSFHSPQMTGTERTALHTGVDADLDRGTVVALPNRHIEWSRVGTIAAAFLGLVVVVGVVSSLGSNNDASTAADGTITESLAAESAAAAGISADTDAAAEPEDVEELAPVAESAQDLPADSVAPPSDLVVNLGSVTNEEFVAAIEQTKTDVGFSTESSGLLTRFLRDTGARCWSDVNKIDDDKIDDVRAAIVGVVNDVPLEAYVYLDGDFVVFKTADCSVTNLP